MSDGLLEYSLLIFASSMIGGGIPLLRRWSDEYLHLFISFGAGIFLSVVFLHLLPESFAGSNSSIIGLMVLLGYLLIFFLERILFVSGEGDDEHGHKVVSITALLGLSVHSIIAGFGLAVASVDARLGSMIFISILAHKIPAAFSLTSLFLLGKMSRLKSLWLLVVFSLMTPLGTLLLGQIFSDISSEYLGYFTGITAGTFLYIATGEMLPEVFHTREHRWTKLLLLLLGVVVMAYLGMME